MKTLVHTTSSACRRAHAAYGKCLAASRKFALVALSFVCLFAKADRTEFWHLQTSDGLADGHVSCICRDRSGYLWFGTIAGLSRFDGYRIRNFYFSATDTTSVISNQINRVFEADGLLWVETNVGYCLYDPRTERFDRHMESWMSRHGMKGRPDLVYADRRGNLWIVVNRHGCYFYSPSTGQHHLFPMDGKPGSIPATTVTDIAERGCAIVLTYDDGSMARLDGAHRRVCWTSQSLRKLCRGEFQKFTTFIDSHCNYWVLGPKHTYVYSQRKRRWYTSVSDFLRTAGYADAPRMLLKDVKENADGELWLATEHDGLYIASPGTKQLRHLAKDDTQPNGLPDHTIRSICFDPSDGVWLGTYQNGVAYTNKAFSRYPTVPLGDVCTIVEDASGRYWCGTNDNGICCYTPSTGAQTRYGRAQTGLTSDVVVSSLRASDGSLWFGSFNGGLTHYINGRFKAYHTADGLANESVWSIAETHDGRIALGTLGGGVQILTPQSGQFVTYNTHTSPIPSDYISGLSFDAADRLVIGHSLGVSIYDFRTRKCNNLQQTRHGKPFSNSNCNQVFTDSRGLIWAANASGLDIYDPQTDSLYTLHGTMRLACAIGEDRRGTMWVSHASGRISRIALSGNRRQLKFDVVSFDRLDGLQTDFNYRSIMADNKGRMVFGGQKGINIVPTEIPSTATAEACAVFSGLTIFDRPVQTGDKFGGRVVLNEALNTSRQLRLHYDENAFSILVATDRVALPQRAGFLYRLENFGGDEWLRLPDGQSAISFTNLSPGTYTLHVKVVGRDGSVSRKESTLRITILPPWWLSAWAFALYVLLAVAAGWLTWYFTVHRKFERLKEQHRRHVDEVKLTFLTNVSHELRTPLALIISPLRVMLDKETDPERHSRLSLIYRNAQRLLSLVNQTLELRKIEEHTAKLELSEADFVTFTRDLCHTFDGLSQKHIELTFKSDIPSLPMSFDADKMEKIVSNLLSNAYKFTPEGGKISVKISHAHGPHFCLSVADTGCGISDADKKHIFDRFYQAKGSSRTPFGGNGIGLNLALEFAKMHGGNITVSDNPGGGTVFTLSLPSPKEVATEAGPRTAEPVPATENSQLEAMNEQLRKGNYEVLVVDDSEDFLTFMTDLLHDTYKVTTATNGREALKCIAHRRPDIILCDVMMPEMDGNELCARLKGNPKTERIPFVMLTARLSTDHKIEGLTNGADDYITKPFNIDLLNLRIYNLIKWHNATPVGEKMKVDIKEHEVNSVDEQLVRDATAFIEENLANPELSVEMLGEKMGMSRANLYKRMLSITGSTPSELIRTIRLRHAQQLLREGQLNVSEVAYKVGFNNPRYFSKYFKEQFGMIPSQYKEGRSADEPDSEPPC